jgi:diguanylate cyclase (GGDEF)-like protein/PAS domain S-box-containing protein
MQENLTSNSVPSKHALTEHYAAMVKDADDAIIANDILGVVTSWNGAAEHIFGYTAEEMIGKSIYLVFPPDKIDEEIQIFKKVSNGIKVEHFNTTRRHKSGEIFNISLTVSPIKNSSGQIIGVSKIVKKISDTTEASWLSNNLTQHTDYYAAIIESSDDAIISKSLDGIVITWNKAAERIFGYTSAEMIGQPMTKVFPEHLYQEEQMILAKISNGEKVKHFRTHRVRKDQKRIDVSVTISPIKDETGKIVGASKIARDVTELILKEKIATELAVRFNHFSAIVESSDDAIISKTLDGVVTSWNSAAESMFGYTAQEMVGAPMTKIFPQDRLHEEDDILAKIARGEKVNHFQTIRLHKGGQEVHVSVTISPVVDIHGKVIGASKIARDITDKVMADRQLWQLANHDNLTQLPNRRLFMKRLDHELARARSENDKFSVMYMDLNDFKQINDKYGHATGDQLLIEVSNRLKACFRQSDTLARLGGDEFAAILPSLTALEDVEKIIIKINNAMSSTFEVNNTKLSMSVSTGAALYPINGESMEAMLHHADVAMYRTKAHQKNAKRMHTANQQNEFSPISMDSSIIGA